ncbi:MAG: LptA/OstA family protein [Mangrovicoccus sp.]
MHRFLLALICGILPAFAFAQNTGVSLPGVTQADEEEPVEITSDTLEVDQYGGTALFTGNVIVIQGDLRMSAPVAMVEYVILPDGSIGDTVDQISAWNGVILVTATEAAESAEAVYFPERDEIIMTGDVLLTQGQNLVTGDELVFDVTTGQGEMQGRVRTVVVPGSETPKE